MANTRYVVPPTSFFRAAAITSFGYLQRDFHFVEVKDGPRVSNPSMHVCVAFESPQVIVRVESDRGTENVYISLKEVPSWLKSGEQRPFSLTEIVTTLAPKEFDSIPIGVREGTLSIEDECHAVLTWLAGALRKYCEPVLRGDSSLLKVIHEKRQRRLAG